jgi:hypothetical protein
VERLITLIQSGPVAARTAALRTLEGIDDPRVLGAAIAAMDDPDSAVAIAAIGLARRYLRGPNGAEAVDRLTATSLDRARPEATRLAALRALGDLDRRTIAPLLKSLVGDPVAAVHAQATAQVSRGRPQGTDSGAILRRAAEQGLSDHPERLRRAVVRGGDHMSLSILLRIVERTRDRDSGAAASARAPWSSVRAAAHLALASRASRLALYDLRESLETASDSLPIEFLTALTMVGDASCLQAMAGAHARSRDAWFRERLADVFRAVVKRERLTRRHAVMKKIQQRWPGTFDLLFDQKSV